MFKKDKFNFLIILLIYSSLLFSQNTRPNVVVIFADDMGYGDVSGLNPHARTETPNIDYLIENGISFAEAHASASVCTPSRYGLLTGRYAFRGAARRVVNGFGGPVISSERKTLGNMFKESGYVTACIGKWHLGVEWQTKDGTKPEYLHESGKSNVDYSRPILTGPNDFGFDYSFVHTASLDMPPYLFIEDHQVVGNKIVLTSDVYKAEKDNTEYAWDKKHTREGDVYWGKGVWWRKGEMSGSFRIEDCLSGILDNGIEYISQRKSSPFFLYLPLTGPHTPWVPTKEFQGKSPIGDYGDFILNIDHVVGEVIKALKNTGELDNTIIIFSSDNGAYWPEEEIRLQGHDSNWGRRGQKGDVWDGGHRVPLVVHWPDGIRESFEYDGLTSLTDWYATFADLLSYEISSEEGEDSFSFLPVIKGDKQHHRRTMIHQGSNGMFAYRKGDWKYIEGLGSGGFTAPSRLEPSDNRVQGQLYNMSDNVKESQNRYGIQREIVQEMKREMEQQIEMGRSNKN